MLEVINLEEQKKTKKCSISVLPSAVGDVCDNKKVSQGQKMAFELAGKLEVEA